MSENVQSLGKKQNTGSLRSTPDAFAKRQSDLVSLVTLAEEQKTLSTTLNLEASPQQLISEGNSLEW